MTTSLNSTRVEAPELSCPTLNSVGFFIDPDEVITLNPSGRVNAEYRRKKREKDF